MSYRLLKLISKLLPKILSRLYKHLNLFRLRIEGVKLGTNICIYDRIYLKFGKNTELSIGNNFLMLSGSGLNPLSRNIRSEIFIDDGGSIIIGNNTGISSCCLWAKEKIIIGNNVKIGGDCIIMDTDAHNLNWEIRAGLIHDEKIQNLDKETAQSKPIIIEDNVLIGTRTIILKGVTIGERSIIAAGSVVVKSIPPDCIAGGNPCKVIKGIFDNKYKNHE